MPSYGFRCEQCAQEYDVTAPLTGPPPMTCDCGTRMRRVFTPVGIIGTASTRSRPPSRPHARDAGHDPSVIGGCVIRPELAAAWSAKNRGDGAAIDRSVGVLESKGMAVPF
ncbi:FmdB family zinc ribbon protein [Plantactinospora sp. GCM10030261]|uniref:FmdB family zinc ribbon protein n=1 Tax=Plantactinospora sp. GCM10030261 TaxID=3273420 RepID=UPI00361D4081